MKYSKLTRQAVVVDAKSVIMGETYTDVITGIKGTATAIYIFVTGCDQVCLSYESGGEQKHLVIDAGRLAEVRALKDVPVARAGGPSVSVPSRVNL